MKPFIKSSLSSPAYDNLSDLMLDLDLDLMLAQDLPIDTARELIIKYRYYITALLAIGDLEHKSDWHPRYVFETNKGIAYIQPKELRELVIEDDYIYCTDSSHSELPSIGKLHIKDIQFISFTTHIKAD